MTPSDHPIRRMFREMRPPVRRTFREFAESEIILPTGPRAGMPFRCDYMPWTADVLAAFDAGKYRRYFLSGPVQSGKTLLGFVLPLMYHLFEVVEPVIVGVPKIDLAQGIWEDRILPAIQRSRYADQVPSRGAGSRGGKFLSVRFRNGATLRFMGAGGGDAQRSSFTARVVVLTEIDKMDEPGAASREADPITQLEARAASYGARARVYGECTMSIPEGRIYREVVEWGTDSRVVMPCPACGERIAPEREGLSGWQDGADVMAARAGARFSCPKCGALWDEAERATALRGSRVEAPVEKTTNTWGFRWNQVSSALVALADIAEQEWRAAKSENPEDERAVKQFVWALPAPREERVALAGLSRDIVLSHVSKHPRGTMPEGCKWLTVGIDLGLWTCWYSAWSWREDAQGYCIDYNPLEVPQERGQPDPARILTALRAFRADTLEAGWAGGRKPDLVLVDSGGESRFQAMAYAWVSEGAKGGYYPSKGRGSGRNQEGWHKPAASPRTLALGESWAIVAQADGTPLVELHSDAWKRAVHSGFASPAGAPGALMLYAGTPLDHLAFARHITAEREEEEFVPGRGVRVWWNQISKNNHYLDTTYMARAAADMLGASAVRALPGPAVAPTPHEAQREARRPEGGRRMMRTRY